MGEWHNLRYCNASMASLWLAINEYTIISPFVPINIAGLGPERSLPHAWLPHLIPRASHDYGNGYSHTHNDDDRLLASVPLFASNCLFGSSTAASQPDG